MTLRAVYFFLMACCGIVAATTLFLSAVLVYAVEPEEFTWRVSPTTGETARAQDACAPIVLDQPAVALRSISQFATKAVLSVNTYDYLDWDQAIPEALNTYFTAAAARAYLADFRRSRLLGTVTDSYYTVTAITIRPAMVIETGFANGVRSWTVQIPVMIRYQTGVTNAGGGTTAHTQNEVFTVVVIEQRPTQLNYRGVAINSITNRTVRVADELDRLN